MQAIVAHGVNIAGGRNTGVRAARNELIACTDAGCLPSPDWLAELSLGLEQADLVSGRVVVEASTPFQQVLSVAHYPRTEELDEPSILVRLSHRLFGRRYVAERAPGGSIAFHRDVWRAVGGFPEHQQTGEDHAFSHSIVDHGFRVAFAPDAVVRWCPPSTVAGNARMFYYYCRGDVRSKGRSRHILRLLAWSGGAAATARRGTVPRTALALGGLAYVALPLQRARIARVLRSVWWQIPLVIALKDVAQLVGAMHGVVDAIRRVPQPAPKRKPRLRVSDLGGHRDRGRNGAPHPGDDVG